MKFIIWWTPKKMALFIEGKDPVELGVRLAFALLFIFLASSVALGMEPILGAFIAGALFGFIFQERDVVAEKISAMGHGFFVPIFFIVVGSHFNPFMELEHFSFSLFFKLISLALIVKFIPSLVLSRINLNLREIFAGSLLLSAPLTLTIAVAELGHELGAIPPNLHGILLLIAILMSLLCPLLARIALR